MPFIVFGLALLIGTLLVKLFVAVEDIIAHQPLWTWPAWAVTLAVIWWVMARTKRRL